MKNIFLIFTALFSITACSDPAVDCDPDTDELCLKNYVGWFYRYGVDKIPTLIITKVGDVFHILNRSNIGGHYSCIADLKVVENWGFEGSDNIKACMYLDCKVLSKPLYPCDDNDDPCKTLHGWYTKDWWNTLYRTPYIKLCHSVSEYNGVKRDDIYYSTYFRGKEYYQECSADQNKQACIFWSESFYRPRKPK